MEYCIYQFLDKDKNIIYIGKAKNLKNRLTTHNHLPIDCYKSIEYIKYTKVKDKESINFIECYFIQKYKPKYNNKMFTQNNIIYEINELNNIKWRTLKNGKEYIKLNYITKKHIKEEEEKKLSQEYINKASEDFLL